MIETTIAHSAHPVPVERIAQAVEEELTRLKAARPALSSRIERAEAILVMQLSVAGGYRPIKVRIHHDGSRSYIVRSGSKLCREYTVNPYIWSYDCPDHRRRHAACKHAIACWALERAFGRPASPERTAACSGCGERFERRELVEVTEDHENLTFFVGDKLCRQGCARSHGVL